jgi:DNA modification methylase
MKQDYHTSVPKKDLEESKQTREQYLAKWGYEATSMWYFHTIHNKTLDTVVEDSLAEGSYITHNFNVRSGALPQSSPIVAERLIRFFTERGEVVGSPFMERLPHLLVANYLGRHAVGQDLCKKFYDHDVAKVKRRLLQNSVLDDTGNKILVETEAQFKTVFNGLNFEIRMGDSRDLSWIPDNTLDFCINSPPYANTIKYDDNPNQLGTGKNNAKDGGEPAYHEFLKGLQDVYRECYRITKPGKFHAVILNDYRMDGIFHTYHADILPYMKEIGWVIHDIIIYNLSSHPLQSIFTSQLARDHHMAKQHEYIMVFRKPD